MTAAKIAAGERAEPVPGRYTDSHPLQRRARRVVSELPEVTMVYAGFPAYQPGPDEDPPIARQAAHALSRPPSDPVRPAGRVKPPVAGPQMRYSISLLPGDTVWIGPDAGPQYLSRFLFRIETVQAAGWRGWVVLTGTCVSRTEQPGMRHRLWALAAGIDVWERPVQP